MARRAPSANRTTHITDHRDSNACNRAKEDRHFLCDIHQSRRGDRGRRPGKHVAFQETEAMRSSTLVLFVYFSCAPRLLRRNRPPEQLPAARWTRRTWPCPAPPSRSQDHKAPRPRPPTGKGALRFRYITPGTYTIRVELTGFNAVERKDINVSLGQTVDLPLTMTVGALTETVDVTASSPLIDRTSTTTGAVISSDLLDRVPVGRRSATRCTWHPASAAAAQWDRRTPRCRGLRPGESIRDRRRERHQPGLWRAWLRTRSCLVPSVMRRRSTLSRTCK